MHRSNFRVKRQYASAQQEPATKQAPIEPLVCSIKEQIENLKGELSPLKANVERLAAPKQDISIPADVAQSLRLAHGRLDRVERGIEQIEKQLGRMSTTFSNALLQMGEKVEKIAGVEDSSFSLAHSLEKLLEVLTARKLRFIRDKNGDLVAAEVTVGKQD